MLVLKIYNNVTIGRLVISMLRGAEFISANPIIFVGVLIGGPQDDYKKITKLTRIF
jgi:hypothetical protein